MKRPWHKTPPKAQQRCWVVWQHETGLVTEAGTWVPPRGAKSGYWVDGDGSKFDTPILGWSDMSIPPDPPNLDELQ